MNVRRWVIWVIALMPLVITLVVLPGMADMVPAHYGVNGMVDRYDSKYTMVLFPGIIIALVIFREVMPRRLGDDVAQQANIAVLDKIMLPLVLVLAGLNLLMVWLAYYQVENIYTTSLNVPQLILAGLSLLFVLIGNLLPKTKPNPYVGIRVPWTLNHPEVWYKTHRVGGMVMTVWGVIGVMIAVFVSSPLVSAMAVVGGTVVMIGSIVLYAYVYHRQLMKRGAHE